MESSSFDGVLTLCISSASVVLRQADGLMEGKQLLARIARSKKTSFPISIYADKGSACSIGFGKSIPIGSFLPIP